MKGRASDWQAQLEDVPPEEFVRDILAVGYQGLVIDRAGYTDRGVQIESDIRTVTNREPRSSPDGRWSFFDLTGLSGKFGTPDDLGQLGSSLLKCTSSERYWLQRTRRGRGVQVHVVR